MIENGGGRKEKEGGREERSEEIWTENDGYP
jgi:hypothetical protein